MQILYFASLRQAIGLAAETIELPREVTTVQELCEWLKLRHPKFASAVGNGRLLRCAINQEFATPGAKVSPTDEVAFFPPMTGG